MRRADVEDIYELSPLQQGMLFHTLLTPGAGTYFEQTMFPLNGPLDIKSFELAWQLVLDRHTILRTSFHWNKVAKPLQVVHRKVRLSVEYLDWRGLSDARIQQRLDAFLIEDRERGFELSEPPLMRLSVITVGDDSRFIVFSLHHLLLDGWSSSLVYKEAQALYEASCRGELLRLPPCRPYGDYIAWLQKQDLSAAEAFWRKRLRGYGGAPPLGIGLPPGPLHEDIRFDLCEARVPAGTVETLRQVARRHRLTLNTIVQGAWALLLSRYSGEEDIVFGATVSGRPPDLEGIESMIGLFINTLPVRTQIQSDADLVSWLRDLQASQAEARQFEHAPLNQIHSWSDFARDVPLFETLVGFENFPAASGDYPVGNIESRIFGQTNYPLTLAVIPGNDWVLRLNFARPRFDPDAMRRLLSHFQQVLNVIANYPMRQVAAVTLLTEEERRDLNLWNETTTNYPRDTTIHQLFEAQVRRAPEAVAVSFDGDSVTYDVLNQRANQLARRLRELGMGREAAVGICVESPIDLVTGMLGVLKAGAAYLPLDPTYPNQRLRFMVEDSRASAIITTGKEAARFAPGVTVLDLENLDDGSREPTDDLPHVTAENLAYVMYTSGTTGGPKGAEITHRAVIRTVRETNYISLGPSQVIAQISNVCFDAATFEIWGALLNGAHLVGIPRAIALSPDDFCDNLRRDQISAVFVTTDLFNQLVKARPDIFRTVSNVLVGGSLIDPKWIAACLREGPPRRLVHVYGPTESTTFASWHLIDKVAERATSIPIGSPLANTQLHVLDRDLSPVPAGVTGEIYIGGDGLARGYLKRPAQTAEKFIPDPLGGRAGARLYRTGDRARRGTDGAIEFIGRLDEQVKIRGFRVEVGEVEAVLRGHAGVSEAVVLARADAPGSKRLAAYVVPRNGSLTVAELRALMQSKLPDYMVPSAIMLREALPLTPNGKVDRKALAAPAERLSSEEPYAEPRTPIEKRLVEIWREVLAVEQVGIHDNFFELGGDSIISIQIIARAREAGLRLTLRQLFQTQTVAELAAVAGAETAVSVEMGPLDGEVPLMPIQQWFFEQQIADPHHFNQASLIETPVGIEATLVAQATDQLFLHHDALRLRFRKESGSWRQLYEAPRPSPFSVVDLRSVSEPNLRARIESEATKIQRSLNLDSGPIGRVVWFDLGERPGRLLFTIHHLGVDTVSWRILLEDFWQTYAHLARGESVALPAKTSSLRQWASRLREHAQSDPVRAELAYWTAAVHDNAGRVPLDLPGGENLAANAEVVEVQLDEQTTRQLVRETPKAYQTQINDVLLTALARVLGAWTGVPMVRFDLEGHGREPIFEDIDLTRTVGWFTTMFPVRLEVNSVEPGEALKAVKEQLRQVPNRGLSFGLLRYLSEDAAVRSQLTAAAGADVAFNYLGQFAPTEVLESSGQPRSPRARRAHLVEINGGISGGCLRVEWEFSRLHHRRETIERIATDFIERLRELISHCQSPKQIAFTPSDFTHAGISQSELDKLVATVDKTEGSVR